jgi:secreted trypsin-like serine protease
MRRRGAKKTTAAGMLPPVLALLLACAGAARAQDAATPRIVGGASAPASRLTHQVWLTMGCGGSLIRRDAVLTAGNCNPTTADKVVPGMYKKTSSFVLNKAISISKAVRHPQFSDDSYGINYDFAIVFLPRCVTLDDATTTLISLPTVAEFDAARQNSNTTMLVSGWGTTSLNADPDGQNGDYPVNLQAGYTKYVTDKTCYYNGYPETSFCAGNVPAMPGGPTSPPMQGPCDGDSGGPLIFNINNLTHPLRGNKSDDRLAGTVSWRLYQSCGPSDRPGVYGKTVSVLSWISSELAKVTPPCSGAGGGGVGGGNGTGTVTYNQVGDTVSLDGKAHAYHTAPGKHS